MRDPKVIEPPGFDPQAAWKACRDAVDRCGGTVHSDGSVNWAAAFSADPGCVSCPNCGQHYWNWGRVVECLDCGFQFPTDWWEKYSWGVQHAKRLKNPPPAFSDPGFRGMAEERHQQYMAHPYYRHGFENPVENAWQARQLIPWRTIIEQERQK